MKQLILPVGFNGENLYTLPAEDSHYLLRVQRRDIGYRLNFMDQDGNKYNGVIVNILDNLCQLKLEKATEVTTNKKELVLWQCIPKGKKLDLIIRQAVEIGVTSIIPIMADHSVPVFKTPEEREKKRSRWEKIIKEASQQSGTSHLTTMEPLQTMNEALESLSDFYTGIFFHQVPLENAPLHETLDKPTDKIILVIGPEGGLSKNEVESLQQFDFIPTLLGENILRAETATIFALGAVQMIMMEKDRWIKK